MPVLTEPTTRAHASFVQALAEYQAEGRYADIDPAQLADAAIFRQYVRELLAAADPAVPRSSGLVHSTVLWLLDGDQYLGQLSIRHALTDILRVKGGHIGYGVRPSQRRRGYATLMLRLGLPVARQLGIDPALVTCDCTNIASRKVIEANCGLLAEESDVILRYWLPTSA